MDEVTQQNSALVEENAATAKTLEHQAHAMDERVAFFRTGETAGSARPAAPPAKPRAVARAAAHGVAAATRRAFARGGPVGNMQAALATAIKAQPDWKEF